MMTRRPAGRWCRRAIVALAVTLTGATSARALRPYPILFVTQTPNPYDFTSIGAVFGNHQGALWSAPRGGDLYVLYPNGTLRNLTQLAGYGVDTGFQGPTSIAVRDPAVDWTGTRAIFSMVIGGPAHQYDYQDYFWQLYEVTGLGPADTPVITHVPNQPADANNVSPVYRSDGRILFTSDRSRDGSAHLYPQRDEYEEAPTVSGLWLLDPATGELTLLDHAPSGDFKPTVDSFGRVVFTRWDHLQRDQQADADWEDEQNGQPPTYGTFNWSSERADSTPLATRLEVYPEPRPSRVDLLQPWEIGHSFNHFFPWATNQDGTGLETLNHIGRHELHTYFEPSFNDDPNLEYFLCGGNSCGRTNPRYLQSLLQIRESATAAGTYFGVEAPEFSTHAAGMVARLAAEPSRPADQIVVDYLTHPDTRSYTDTPGACHSGLYREPLPLSDGTLVVVHAGERAAGQPETRADANEGTSEAPASRYRFRLRALQPAASPCTGYQRYGATLTPGIQKTLWYWSPDVRVDYANVTMWELDPVEVRPRTPPPMTTTALEAPELAMFQAESVDVTTFRQYLRERDLAVIVARDVTTRDLADRQQPFNLRVPDGTAQTLGAGGRIYDVSYLQVVQADLLRGLGGTQDPRDGRRVLGRFLHDPRAKNPPPPAGAPAGSVAIAGDGSVAAFVPAHRALSWQTTDGTGRPVVRERYWLSMPAGEIRTCGSCHGINSQNQAGDPPPANSPEALRLLLQWWKGVVFTDGFESGNASLWSVQP